MNVATSRSNGWSIRKFAFSDAHALKKMLGHNFMEITNKDVFIHDQNDDEGVIIAREHAIDLAEAILTHYKVPFCNRVRED